MSRLLCYCSAVYAFTHAYLILGTVGKEWPQESHLLVALENGMLKSCSKEDRQDRRTPHFDQHIFPLDHSNHSRNNARNYMFTDSSTNSNEERWEALRNESISFIRRTHGRKEAMEQWSEIIESSFQDDSAEGEEKYLGKYKGEYDTCIVVGFLSRSIEFGLRAWQRNEFQQQLSRFPDFYKKKKVHVQQRFMIGVNPDHSTMAGAIVEQHHYGDVMILKINEGYHYLTAHTWDTFHQLIPVLENPSCRSAFLVRADTDFILNYKALAETIFSMPKTSTYFGTMIPNYPVPEPLVREFGSFADDFLPVWAVGGLYGFSLDIVKQLVSYNVERTILKKDERYVYPEEDRAVGFALSRSNTTVNNYLFTKATFHFCPPENFTCADYGHFMGFSVGFGKSGSNQSRLDTKMEHLQRISDLRNICEETLPPFKASDYLFKVHGDFKKKKPFNFLTYGCRNLNDEGEEFIAHLKESYSLALVGNKNQLDDDKCAERIYLEVNPEVSEYMASLAFEEK